MSPAAGNWGCKVMQSSASVLRWIIKSRVWPSHWPKKNQTFKLCDVQTLKLCWQEVLLSRNPSRSCGHLSHAWLSAWEQGEGEGWTENKNWWHLALSGLFLSGSKLLPASYLLPFQTRRQRCQLPCPQAAVGKRLHTAPCTPLSAAGFHSHKLSISLLLASIQS